MHGADVRVARSCWACCSKTRRQSSEDKQEEGGDFEVSDNQHTCMFGNHGCFSFEPLKAFRDYRVTGYGVLRVVIMIESWAAIL
jgi:hypothetical protein